MESIKPKCGIVCEYNPFHNGHAYHIAKTRELTGAEIVCVMSGDFVQRAEPAIFDKRVRARAAILAGADAVIELPVVYSTAGAAQFAYGAVSVMAAVKGLKYISFGIETDNMEFLKTAAEIQLNESAGFKAVLKNALRDGASYAAAIALATAAEYERMILNPFILHDASESLPPSDTLLLNPSTPLKSGENLVGLTVNKSQPQFVNRQSSIVNVLKAPNNILAIEYLKAIKRLNLNITPVFIKRTDRGYNSAVLTPPFAAAGAIRGLIERGMPYNAFTPIDYGISPVNFKVFEALARQALLRCTGFSVSSAKNPGCETTNSPRGILHCAQNDISGGGILGCSQNDSEYCHIKQSEESPPAHCHRERSEESPPCSRIESPYSNPRYAIDQNLLLKLKKGTQKHSSLDEIIKFCKSKNNTYAAIKRGIFHVMSDITCDILNYKGIFYAKLLAIKKSFKPCLKDLNENILISSVDEKKILSKENYASGVDETITDGTENPYPLRIYNIDKHASDLYAVITNQDSNRYFKQIIVSDS